MRTLVAALLGAVLFGMLLPTATASAAPAIALAPATLPPGGTTTVTGTGFAPAAKLELFLILPQFGGARVKLANLVAGADGGFTATARLNSTVAPGPTPLVVVGGGTDLARAILTVTDAPTIAPERLSVTPASGPAGTRFVAVGEGLAPGQTVILFTTESAKGPAGNFRQVGQLAVPADGRVRVTIDSAGYNAEDYDVILFGPGGPEIGLPQAVAKFTVTAPGMPGLPSTGGGHKAADGRTPRWGLLGLSFLGGLGLLGWARRRWPVWRRGQEA